MKQRMIHGAVALLAVWLSGAACASSAAPPVPNDACSLVTQSQVSAALGVGVDAGVRPVAGDPSFCTWREQGNPDGIARNVIINIIDASTFQNGLAKMARNPNAPQSSGIGDDAYFFRPHRLPVNLRFKKGDAYIRIMVRSSVTGPADDQDKSIEKTLAMEIIKKL